MHLVNTRCILFVFLGRCYVFHILYRYFYYIICKLKYFCAKVNIVRNLNSLGIGVIYMCEHGIINIQNGIKFDWNVVLEDNAMLKVRPELFKEWNFEKNDELGLDIYKVAKWSNKRSHWCCEAYPTEHQWVVAIGHRAGNNSDCPYCSGRNASYQNNFSNSFPKIANEWDYEKNEKTPDMYTPKSNQRVWWKCAKQHSYPQTIKHRVNGGECIYCTNRAILLGFNDMATTNPQLANLLFDKNDGQKYMQFSNQKVDWICSNCDEHIKNKRISDVNIYGLSCAMCSGGIKYPEKVMREVLKQLNVQFEREKTFEWSGNKRYDFYIPLLNMIIETHGGQHFNGGFRTQGGKTLEEEIINDIEKQKLALKNNIQHYLVIDSRESDLEYIKMNIVKSPLTTIYDLSTVDWMEVESVARTSLSHQCLLLWNDGMKDIEVIAKELGIHREMVRRYLKKWSEISKCDFNTSPKNKRKIIQLSLELEFIKEWESISAATTYYDGTNKSSKIYNCIIGINEEAYDFKWLYKSGYEEYSVSGNLPKPLPNKSYSRKSVVKLNDSLELLEVYSSIIEAALKNNIKSYSHISSCCKGKRNVAGGFKWMYKDDYDKMILGN